MSLGMFPHRHPNLIHAPGTCECCDRCPELQQLRLDWGCQYSANETAAPVITVESPYLCATVEQAQPTPAATAPVIQMLVMQDLLERAEVGRQRYGTYLTPGNGRDALTDAYQEVLDLAVYLRQVIAERVRG